MMNMPMASMPMMNMPMANMPMMSMPMANMPMMNMPMANMPMYDCNMVMSDDDDLKSMYPKVYIRLYPMVKHHCDMMIAKHGKMYCPSKDEMDNVCKEIADKYKEHHGDHDDHDDHDHHEHHDDHHDDHDGGCCRDDGDDMSRRSRFGGGGLQDIARILLIGNLIGGRFGYGY